MSLLKSLLEIVDVLLSPSPCRHPKWRPVVEGWHTARMCARCQTVQRLTHEQFYAQFGEVVYKAMRVYLRGKE